MQTELATTESGTNRASKPKPVLKDYLPLVRFLAESIQARPPDDVDIDDLYAAGLAGLWEAYATFEPTGKLGFGTSSQLCVLASLQDHMRRRLDSANSKASTARWRRDRPGEGV